MPEFCDVALPVPLDQLYTYSVPDALTVQPGVRVVVPFGRRKLVGVVARCASSAAGLDPAAIKPIQKVVDEAPVVSDELLRMSYPRCFPDKSRFSRRHGSC